MRRFGLDLPDAFAGKKNAAACHRGQRQEAGQGGRDDWGRMAACRLLRRVAGPAAPSRRVRRRRQRNQSPGRARIPRTGAVGGGRQCVPQPERSGRARVVHRGLAGGASLAFAPRALTLPLLRRATGPPHQGIDRDEYPGHRRPSERETVQAPPCDPAKITLEPLTEPAAAAKGGPSRPSRLAPDTGQE